MTRRKKEFILREEKYREKRDDKEGVEYKWKEHCKEGAEVEENVNIKEELEEHSLENDVVVKSVVG